MTEMKAARLYPLNSTKYRRTRWVNRSHIPPLAVVQTPRRRPLEIEQWLDLETSSGLANCLATSSNVRGRQWTLVDIALRPANKSGH